MINAWGVEVLFSDGYRIVDVHLSQPEAEAHAKALGGRLVPYENFHWKDAKKPFVKGKIMHRDTVLADPMLLSDAVDNYLCRYPRPGAEFESDIRENSMRFAILLQRIANGTYHDVDVKEIGVFLQIAATQHADDLREMEESNNVA